jgi:uncharacterized membrane protein
MKKRKKAAGDPGSKLLAFLGVFLLIIGFLIVYFTRRKDGYAMHYAKQGLVMTVVLAVLFLLAAVPFGVILTVLGVLVMLVFWIMGWAYSLSGDKKDVPLIGWFAGKMKI